MSSTTLPGGDDARRSAHRRIGTAATAAFVALLLLGAVRSSAGADTSVPASTPASTPAPSSSSTDQVPADPSAPPFHHHRDGFGGGDGGRGGFDGGAAPDAGAPGAGASPAVPSADGATT